MPSSAALSMTHKEENAWRNFSPGDWCTSIDVRDFIVRNATPYTGDEKFLAAPTARTKAVWAKLRPYFIEEQKKGVLAADAQDAVDVARAQARLYRSEERDLLSVCKPMSRSSARYSRRAGCGWSRPG